MGVYVPNMEKPKDCRHCPRRIQYDDGWSVRDKCLELNRNINYKYGDQVVMQNDCPLIEIDLVRCGECKYWADDMSGNMWCEHAIGGLTEPTDFCSYGERIDEYEKEYRELGLYELRELRKGERKADGNKRRSI